MPLSCTTWTEAAALTIVPSPAPEICVTTHLARAIGAARIGRLAEARMDMAEIDSIAKVLLEKGRGQSTRIVRQRAGLCHCDLLRGLIKHLSWRRSRIEQGDIRPILRPL